MDPELAVELRRFSEADPAGGVRVEHALGPLLGDLPLDVLTLGHVDTALIRALQDGPERLSRLRPALARFLDAAGQHRAARRCRDVQWAEAEEAVTADPSRLKATLAGFERSPYLPPHLPDFQFRPAPSVGEVRAQVAVARALEVAVETGRLRPGAPDLEDRRRRLAGEVLDQPAPAEEAGEATGRTWREVVEADRLVAWRQSRSVERERLVDRVLPLVADPVPVAELDLRLAQAAGTLLELAASGIGFRGTVVERGTVDALARRMGWPRPRRLGRADAPHPVDHLFAALWRCGLLEPAAQHRAVPSRLGDTLAGDWEALADHLCRWSFAQVGPVLETLMLLLLGQPEWTAAALVEAARPVVEAEGMATGAEGPERRAAAGGGAGRRRDRLGVAVAWLAEVGRAHAFCESSGSGQSRRITCAGPGRANLRALVRGRATGSGTAFVPLG